MKQEHVSESLLGLLEGRLNAEETASIEGHLASCDECAAEYAALVELTAPITPLTAAESDTVRSAVRRALHTPVTETVVPLRSRPRVGSYARWLGAAALILGGIVFGSSLLTGGGGSALRDSGGAAGGQAEDPTAVAEVSDRLRFRRPQPVPRSAAVEPVQGAVPDGQPVQEAEQGRAGDSGGGGGVSAGDAAGTTEEGDEDEDKAASSGYAGPPRPMYVTGTPRLTERKLTLIGRYGLPLVLFPRAYSASEANESRELFLAQLANAAETDERARQIVDCGAQVLARDTPTLPALATFGEYEDTEVLVLAFAWSPKPAGRLNRYMVWTWPAGDCNGVPSYRAGTIGV